MRRSWAGLVANGSGSCFLGSWSSRFRCSIWWPIFYVVSLKHRSRLIDYIIFMGVMTGHFDNNLGNLIKLKLICVSGDCDCPLFGKAKSRCKESGWHFNYSCKFPYIIDLPFKNLTKSHASQKDKKPV